MIVIQTLCDKLFNTFNIRVFVPDYSYRVLFRLKLLDRQILVKISQILCREPRFKKSFCLVSQVCIFDLDFTLNTESLKELQRSLSLLQLDISSLSLVIIIVLVVRSKFRVNWYRDVAPLPLNKLIVNFFLQIVRNFLAFI